MDVTYNEVLTPAVLESVGRNGDLNGILDVGCGTGLLTLRLAGMALRAVGIDPSSQSVGLALTNQTNPLYVHDNVSFVHASVEQYAADCAEVFDHVVANMVLMDMPSLSRCLSSIAQLTKPDGIFSATITHPWFWPIYWRYDQEPWFQYSEEIYISAPFNISLESTGFLTTHIHRPLEQYVAALNSSNFRIEQIRELEPAPEIAARYSAEWRFPRYLLLRCRKV